MTAIRGTVPMPSVSGADDARAILEEALSVYRMDPGLALHRAAEAALLRRLVLREPILDLGCHDGDFSWLALRPVAAQADIVGSDRDLEALARCRARGMHRGLVGLDATRLPFRARTFGSVICNSVLTHVDELSGTLREIARVLVPGGVLAATVPTPAFHRLFAPVRLLHAFGLRSAAQRVATGYDRNWNQRHFLSEAEWRALLEGAELSLESWTEYLGPRGSLQWSSLFLLTRVGVGRATLGALLRRLFPAGAKRSQWLERRLAAWLAPALRLDSSGGSALVLARRA